MVGGSTRIPKIEQNIRNKFGNSKIQFDINPDEAIALGAAIVAHDNNVWRYFEVKWYFVHLESCYIG